MMACICHLEKPGGDVPAELADTTALSSVDLKNYNDDMHSQLFFTRIGNMSIISFIILRNRLRLIRLTKNRRY
ncbi:MAG: hypothetical protein ACTSWN_11310 [Promethearchaeota archaeon]